MKKNRFLTFLFSIIPGVGHMYLGYMKRGVEFMTMFAVSAYLSFLFISFSRGNGIEFIGVIFLIILPIIWFYQMFDSMHIISQMKRLQIEVPQDDGFFIPGFDNITNIDALKVFKNRKVAKTIAAILVIFGAYILFVNITGSIGNILSNNYYYNPVYYQTYNSIMNYVPSVIISLVLIFAGIKLLLGKNSKNNNQDNQDGDE